MKWWRSARHDAARLFLAHELLKRYPERSHADELGMAATISPFRLYLLLTEMRAAKWLEPHSNHQPHRVLVTEHGHKSLTRLVERGLRG